MEAACRIQSVSPAVKQRRFWTLTRLFTGRPTQTAGPEQNRCPDWNDCRGWSRAVVGRRNRRLTTHVGLASSPGRPGTAPRVEVEDRIDELHRELVGAWPVVCRRARAAIAEFAEVAGLPWTAPSSSATADRSARPQGCPRYGRHVPQHPVDNGVSVGASWSTTTANDSVSGVPRSRSGGDTSSPSRVYRGKGTDSQQRRAATPPRPVHGASAYSPREKPIA